MSTYEIDIPTVSLILFTSLVSSLLTGVFVFLFQKLVESSFLRNIEKFKSELELSISKQKTIFISLQEKQAEVIAEIFRLLVMIRRGLEEMNKASGETDEINLETRENIRARTKELIEELDIYYEINRIFLPEGLALAMVRFSSRSLISWHRFYYADKMQEKGDTKRENEQRAEAYEILTTGISEVIREIEKKFREILGNSSSY